MTGGTLVESVRCLLESAGAPPDASLLERFAATRDESASAALVRRHGPMVFGVCRRVARTRHDAEDAFQVTFLELARQASAVGRRGALAAWLCRVAYRAARKARRRPLAPLAETVAPVERDRTPPELDEELDRLPAIYREPLVLVYLHGLSNAEAAARLGCPIGTIFTRLSRGRDRLRAALARRGIGSLPVLVPAVVPPALVGRVVASALAVQTSGMLAGIGGAIVLHKLKAFAAVLLLASAVAAGVMLPSRPASVPAKVRHAAPPVVAEPLPEGALMRLGSTKFRHAILGEFVCLPGGKTAMTSGRDGVLRTWDLLTGRQLRAVRLEGTRETTEATLSGDGRKAAARCAGKIVLWDAVTGKKKKTLDAPKGEAVYLLFSNDGHTLAAWTIDWLDLHDLKKGEVRTVAVPPRPPAFSAFHGNFSLDGRHLSLGGGSTAPLSIYDVAKGKELHRFHCHATGSVFSPDGTTLIVSSMQDDAGKTEPSIRVYDVATGKSLKCVTEGITAYYFTLAFSPDEKRLVCAGHETACVMDARTFGVLRDIPGRVQQPRFSFDGKRIISTNYTRLRFWDPATGKEIDPSDGEFSLNPLTAFSRDGRLLASAGWVEGHVVLWDLKTGRVVRSLPLGGEKKYARSVSFSADGKALAATQYKGFIQTWDVATGKEIGSVQLLDPERPKPSWAYFYTLLLSSDGKTASTLEQSHHHQKEVTSLCLWDRKTGERLSKHILPAGTRWAAWRPDGRAVALPLPDGLTLLDVKTGKTVWRSAGPVQKPIHASPDFRLIVAGKTKTTVGVWDGSTGKEVATLDVGDFTHVALASENRTLVVSDAERIRVLDIASGKEVLSRPLPVVIKSDSGATFVNNLTLAPDGRRAFTSHADGTGMVWDIAWKRPAREATEKELATWWTDFASDDAGRAWRAAWALTDAKAGAFLKGRLLPTSAPDAALLALIAALDADAFAEREAAEKALAKSGAAVVPALRAARDKATSAEAKRRLDRLLEPHGRFTADELRRLRAADVLRMLQGK